MSENLCCSLSAGGVVVSRNQLWNQQRYVIYMVRDIELYSGVGTTGLRASATLVGGRVLTLTVVQEARSNSRI